MLIGSYTWLVKLTVILIFFFMSFYTFWVFYNMNYFDIENQYYFGRKSINIPSIDMILGKYEKEIKTTFLKWRSLSTNKI